MQTKRQQSMADRKNQAATAKAERAKIEENLLALEAFRRKQRSQDGAGKEVSNIFYRGYSRLLQAGWALKNGPLWYQKKGVF